MTLLKMKRHSESKWERRYNAAMDARRTLFAKVFLSSMIVGMVVSGILQVIAYGN